MLLRDDRATVRWTRAIMLAYTLASPCPPAVAEAGPRIDPAVQQAISAYLRDQRAGRRGLLAVARQQGSDGPPVVRVLMADAYLRSGQMTSARKILQGVLAGNDGPPWTSFADLMLGWLAFATGGYGAARLHYGRLADWDLTREMVPVVLGLIDAADARPADATAELSATVASAGSPTDLRVLARLGIGYAHYWSGDLDAAARAFEAVATRDSASAFGDDAKYAAAWSWWRAGNHDQAVAQLHAMVGTDADATPPRERAHLPLSLVNLEPRAVLRASMKRYRQVPLDRPNEQLVRLFDMDARDLAESALVRIDEGLTSDKLIDRPTQHALVEHSRVAPSPALVPPIAPSREGSGPTVARSGWPDAVFALLALGVVAVTILLLLGKVRSRGRLRSELPGRR